jgi:drug/metabolite transporter (DMT)-like permease
MTEHVGEFAALATAVCWMFTALSFESAGRRVGSLAVNLIRLILAFFLLCAFTWITRGQPLPTDATAHAWFWLSLSGLVGLTMGDGFLFQAFVEVGSRISMLIMSSVPVLTTILSWLIMGETLSAAQFAGMTVTLAGIAMVVLERNPERRKVKLSRPARGILLAFGGAFGQALGLVLSKYGMRDYDPFAATQIRGIAGILGFCVLFFFMKFWRRVGSALRHGPAMRRIGVGAFFGPFLGVSLSLLAIQRTQAGVAATIIAITPVLIIPPAVLLFKERVTLREVVGAVIAVCGVAVMFLV